MDVEDRFMVYLPDEECENVRTVADIVALVLKRIPECRGVCTTSRTFYELRSLLVKHAGLERKQVYPKAQLSELQPLHSRWVWNRIYAKDWRLPALVISDRDQRVLFRMHVAAVCAGLCVFFAIMTVSPDIALFIGMVWVIAIVCGSIVLHMYFARTIPAEFATVGDLVRYMSPMEMPPGFETEQFTQEFVLEEVRKLIAQSSGMPLEQVKPTSDLIRDLGME